MRLATFPTSGPSSPRPSSSYIYTASCASPPVVWDRSPPGIPADDAQRHASTGPPPPPLRKSFTWMIRYDYFYYLYTYIHTYSREKKSAVVVLLLYFTHHLLAAHWFTSLSVLGLFRFAYPLRPFILQCVRLLAALVGLHYNFFVWAFISPLLLPMFIYCVGCFLVALHSCLRCCALLGCSVVPVRFPA